MRVVIIVLIVIAVLFAVTAIWGAQEDGGGGGGCPMPPESQDPDVIASWTPCGFIDGLGALMAPFVPSVKLAKRSLRLAAAAPMAPPEVLAAPAADERIRVARIKITQGAVRAAFTCNGSCTDPYSKKSVCACAPGASLNGGADIDACGAQWRERNAPAGTCVAEPAEASLLVPREGGDLSFVAVGPAGAELEIE